MSFIKRTRMISARLSEDEYEALQRISRENGANSVSDYVRRLVVSSASAVPGSQNSTQGVAAEVAELHRKVDWLVQIVEASDKSAIAKPTNGKLGRPGSRQVEDPNEPTASSEEKTL